MKSSMMGGILLRSCLLGMDILVVRALYIAFYIILNDSHELFIFYVYIFFSFKSTIDDG